MKIQNLLKPTTKTRQKLEIPGELDLNFYRHWYDDLANLPDRSLVQHWLRHGSMEGRHPNFAALIAASGADIASLPEDFSYEMYGRLNPDIADGMKNGYIAKYHYILHGHLENRPFRFDHKFYQELYKDLHGLDRLEDAARHWVEHGRREGRFPTLNDLLSSHGIDPTSLPIELNLELIHQLNPDEHFDSIAGAIAAAVQQRTARKIRVYSNDEENADFYVRLAMHNEVAGRTHQALELHRLSLLFFDAPTAHEHIGNLMQQLNRPYQAVAHYQKALERNSESHWVYYNLSKTLSTIGRQQDAVEILCDGIVAHPGSTLLLSILDQCIQDYWQQMEQVLECIAETQDRSQLIREYSRVVEFICTCYRKVFRRNSTKSLDISLNDKKVLIVGLDFESAPQCFRYRIEQKMEQLEHAGYETETIPWHARDAALNLINFYDIIIFYRVPGFPGVIKQVEYAKSLGKITFFEVDDLLFEEISVPPLETYGGQVPLSAYTNLTKDIGSYRAIASQCDYAIASTIPLADKLGPLVRSNISFLHRNGLDRHNHPIQKNVNNGPSLTIFYGSGTLAHNSDFVDGALPAIQKILREYPEIKLMMVGYLTLPESFLNEFKDQLIRLPFTREISTYLTYLSYADINLAVLNQDELTDCKSELKWFEAATFAVPSIVSCTRNYMDVIKQDVDGIVVSNGKEWYDALKRLIENPLLRRSIGQTAFNRVQAEYSIEALSFNIDAVIREAVAHQSMKPRTPLK